MTQGNFKKKFSKGNNSCNKPYKVKNFEKPFQQVGVGTSLKPIQLYCDNRTSIHKASKPVFHECTKHIKLNFHLVREKIQTGVIQTIHMSTNQQPTNLFTKALGQMQFNQLFGKLGVIKICSNLKGSVKKCNPHDQGLRNQAPCKLNYTAKQCNG